jgi:hypothetical protein
MFPSHPFELFQRLQSFNTLQCWVEIAGGKDWHLQSLRELPHHGSIDNEYSPYVALCLDTTRRLSKLLFVTLGRCGSDEYHIPTIVLTKKRLPHAPDPGLSTDPQDPMRLDLLTIF